MSWTRPGAQPARLTDMSMDNSSSLEDYANEEAARLQARIDESNRISKVSLWMMSNPKSFLNLGSTDVGGLWFWTIAALLLNLGASITLFVVFGSVSSVKNSDVKFTLTTVSRFGWNVQDAVTWNATALAAVVCAVNALGYLVDLAFWNSNKIKNLQCRQNWSRWLIDSLSTPLLWVATISLLGFNNIITSLFQFIVIHIAIACGGLVDLVNAPKSSWSGMTWWPYLFSVWTGLLGTVPIIILLAKSTGLNYANGLALGSFGLLLASWFVQSWLQRGYYNWLTNPAKKAGYNSDDGAVKNYVRYETMVLVSATILRTIAVFLVGFAYTANNPWSTEHNCFNDRWQQVTNTLSDSINLSGTACSS